eukprot:TRINITY_DN100292_c0_g1_i1.p1 TRINITY_DN100292_c0_g1~~TRINITY_DN100292_c0_g1_i1.p1  ORF type:complete len:185 (-),score=25.09 TRINITY_DN100292_c0_g1_i1:27-581(-)
MAFMRHGPMHPSTFICRLVSVDESKGELRERPFQIFELRGVWYTYGRADFNEDCCIKEEHVRFQFTRQRPTLHVLLLSNVPAFVWRNGDAKTYSLTPNRPVELAHGDRFSLLHMCHVFRVEIGKLKDLPVFATPRASIDAEKQSLLGNDPVKSPEKKTQLVAGDPVEMAELFQFSGNECIPTSF